MRSEQANQGHSDGHERQDGHPGSKERPAERETEARDNVNMRQGASGPYYTHPAQDIAGKNGQTT